MKRWIFVVAFLCCCTWIQGVKSSRDLKSVFSSFLVADTPDSVPTSAPTVGEIEQETPPDSLSVEIPLKQLITQEQQQECGYQMVQNECQLQNQIFGGDDAHPIRFPYMVSLQIEKQESENCFYHFCGATLVASDIVLTAAHCIQEVAHTQSKSGQTLMPVYASLAPLCRHQQSYDALTDRAVVKFFIIHPDYAKKTLKADIALLKLSEPLSNGPFARYKSPTIYLPGYVTTNAQSLSVLGYGDTTVREAQLKEYNVVQLRRAKLMLMQDGVCEDELAKTSAIRELMPSEMICAYNRSADACGGDSGGPLIITGAGQLPGEAEKVEFDYQVGIVSWGPGEACTSEARGEQTIGVYTELPFYEEWLDDTVAELQSNADLEDILVSDASFDTDSDCVTVNSCQCKSFWQFQGKSQSACANPDSDDNGDWCVVDVKTCGENQPEGTLSITGEFWDRCQCQGQEAKQSFAPGCPTTEQGCECRFTWKHSGEQYIGCANPDNDPNGSWCYIQGDFSTCSPASENLDGRLVTSEINGDFLGYFDYCKPECSQN